MARHDRVRTGSVSALSSTHAQVDLKRGHGAGSTFFVVGGAWTVDGLTLDKNNLLLADRVQAEMHDLPLLAGRLRGAASRQRRARRRALNVAEQNADLHDALAAVYECTDRARRAVALAVVQAGFTGTRAELMAAVDAAYQPAAACTPAPPVPAAT